MSFPGTGGDTAGPPRADEPDQRSQDARRGAAADDAGGSVADSMRTPGRDREQAEAEQLEDFDEHA